MSTILTLIRDRGYWYGDYRHDCGGAGTDTNAGDWGWCPYCGDRLEDVLWEDTALAEEGTT